MKTLYVANRGEIACRVIRSARAMGYRCVTGYSDADRDAMFVAMADDAVYLGESQPAASYLNVQAVIGAIEELQAELVHPGYGFLSENAQFAEKILERDLVWIGPDPDCIDKMGDKEQARSTMGNFGVPLVPGVNDINALEQLEAAASALGYPVLLKAAMGGGGIGMRAVASADELAAAFEETRTRAERAFGSGRVFVEKFVQQPHHIEVQIFGTPSGVHTLFERECSVQRRHQKIAEESPSPFAIDSTRNELYLAAKNGAQGLDYRNAGTFEFLVDGDQRPYFLEVNTRLQVEHPVTEMITGLDLVALQLRTAEGEDVSEDIRTAVARGPQGHALEFRLYAENPKNFFPSPGSIDVLDWPEGEGIRIDTGVRSGDTITPFYDPMIAKIITHGADRNQAMDRMRAALAETRLEGLKSNLPFLQELVENEQFVAGRYDTGLVRSMRPNAKGI